jgi:DNA repair protein RadD
MYELRPYQIEAVEAVHVHICTKQTNPCAVLPTGSGKSVVMAETIRRWKKQAPWVRGCILAHRKELVQQNAEKLKSASGDSSIGLFSAGLGRKDFDSPILFASIDSIYKRSGEFQPFDFIFVDEAHRIPPSGEGKYRTFIKGCQRFNPELKVVGWTATPFRMGCGPVCHKDHILKEVCYEAGVTELIEQGYLCRLRSKVGECQPELTDVKRNNRGDYITTSLASATNRNSIVEAAVREAVSIINQEQRKHIVFFCVDVEHCEKVSNTLRKYGIYAPCITGKTKSFQRDKILNDFRAGKLRAICNVNVLTEGFDAPNIDCIVLLRPTLSPGLYSQMVGRGLRLFVGKQDCLVLDFANCIDEHGPIDLVGQGHTVIEATCQNCRESFSRAIRRCPQCGWEIPKQEVERLEQKERERRLHGDKASSKSILSNEPETVKVEAVYVARHVKPGQPDSIKVQYRSGMSMFREWICLNHEGYAGQRAQKWYSERVGKQDHKVTVNEALENMFLSQAVLEYTKTITVRRNKKYYEIVGYNKEV